MKRYYHEFKMQVDYTYESLKGNDMVLVHTDSGMHLHVYNTKKEVMEIINSINDDF